MLMIYSFVVLEVIPLWLQREVLDVAGWRRLYVQDVVDPVEHALLLVGEGARLVVIFGPVFG